MRRKLIALIAVAAVCVAAQAYGAKKRTPDATIVLKGKSVAVGVGVSWGSGTLIYKGKTYPIAVTGLDVGDVGATNITASGNVYHLKQLAEFDGNYATVGAGAALGGGGGAVAMENQNGVKVHLVSTTQGVKLTLATGGVKMSVKK